MDKRAVPRVKLQFYRRPYGKLIVKWCLVVVMMSVVIGVTVAGLGVYLAYEKLRPSLREAELISMNVMRNINEDTFTFVENTKVYDASGSLLMELNKNNVDYIEYENISRYILDGYIAMEDKNFWVHNGIDYTSILRAAKELILNKGKITQGGSTITQQLLKVNVLNNLEAVRSNWDRKFIEFFLAPTFEQNFTKEEILEFYCNTNYYQNNCVGVEAASRFYFGKSAKDVTADEAATLIGISNSPSRYNPVKNPEMCVEKRDRVLYQMYTLGAITQQEYDEGVSKELILTLKRSSTYQESYPVSLALHQATLQLMELDNFKFQYTFKNEVEYNNYQSMYSAAYSKYAHQVRQGGYTIRTSIDSEVQNLLQEQVDAGMVDFTEIGEDGRYLMQASATLIDNELGRVVAVVGGRGNEEFNRAYQSHRQPGSSIKPLLYATALNTGRYYPSLLIDDSKIEEKGAPNNYDNRYKGAVSLREALERSTNTVAYRVITELTVDTFLERLKSLRFTGVSWQDNGVKSLSVGGFTYGVNTLEAASAYYTLVNGGLWNDTSCITEISYQRGIKVTNKYSSDDAKKKSVKVFEEDAAYLTLDMMRGVLTKAHATGRQMNLGKIPAAGKTGTTNVNKDEWFCGVTANYTLAVWVGYDMPAPIPNVGAGKHAGAIWKDAMLAVTGRLDEQRQLIEFATPNSIIKCDINKNGFSIFKESELISVGGKVYTVEENTNKVFDSQMVGRDLFSVRILEVLSKNTSNVADYSTQDERQTEESDYASVTGELASEYAKFKNQDVNNRESLEVFENLYTRLMQLAIAENNTEAKVRIDRHYNTVMNSASVKALLERIAEEDRQATIGQGDITSAPGMEEHAEQVRAELLQQAEQALNLIENMGTGDERMQQAMFNAYSAVESCRNYGEYSAFKSRYDTVSQRYKDYVDSLSVAE